MSILDNLKKFVQPYSDDEYDEDYEDELDDLEEEVQETAPRGRRPSPFATAGETDSYTAPAPAATTSTGFSGQVVSMGGKQEVVLFHLVNFNDTSKAADDLRNRKAVIVNMENVDKAMARRVVDFLTGCAYALDGKVNKIAHCTYLFCPYSMDVVGDLEAAQAETESYI